MIRIRRSFNCMEREQKAGGRTAGLLQVLGLAAAGLVLHALSCGPAVYLHERGILSRQIVRTVYRPMIRLEYHRETLLHCTESYAGWWSKLARLRS